MNFSCVNIFVLTIITICYQNVQSAYCFLIFGDNEHHKDILMLLSQFNLNIVNEDNFTEHSNDSSALFYIQGPDLQDNEIQSQNVVQQLEDCLTLISKLSKSSFPLKRIYLMKNKLPQNLQTIFKFLLKVFGQKGIRGIQLILNKDDSSYLNCTEMEIFYKALRNFLKENDLNYNNQTETVLLREQDLSKKRIRQLGWFGLILNDLSMSHQDPQIIEGSVSLLWFSSETWEDFMTSLQSLCKLQFTQKQIDKIKTHCSFPLLKEEIEWQNCFTTQYFYIYFGSLEQKSQVCLCLVV